MTLAIINNLIVIDVSIWSDPFQCPSTEQFPKKWIFSYVLIGEWGYMRILIDEQITLREKLMEKLVIHREHFLEENWKDGLGFSFLT